MPRLSDFEVIVTFLGREEGGRTMRPFQGYRSDVMFLDDPKTLHMIHPEFLNEDGTPYPKETPVPPTVRANMYVFRDEHRPFYRDKIHVGQTLRIVEGPRTVAMATVTAIKNLLNDSHVR